MKNASRHGIRACVWRRDAHFSLIQCNTMMLVHSFVCASLVRTCIFSINQDMTIKSKPNRGICYFNIICYFFIILLFRFVASRNTHSVHRHSYIASNDEDDRTHITHILATRTWFCQKSWQTVWLFLLYSLYMIICGQVKRSPLVQRGKWLRQPTSHSCNAVHVCFILKRNINMHTRLRTFNNINIFELHFSSTS